MPPFVRPLLTVAAVLALALGCASLAHADTFEDANHAFAAGHYAESARGYETVLKQNGNSPAVLFNLANADERLGNVGEAILNYQRARWLAPHDPDIVANLRFAQKQAGVAVTEDSWAEHATDLFDANTWAWLGGAALLALCTGILVWQFQGRARPAIRLLCVSSAAFLIFAAVAVAVRLPQLDCAVLPQKGTQALLSPFDGAKTLFAFPAGESVRIEKTHANYSFVRDANGRTGWVDNLSLGRVVST